MIQKRSTLLGGGGGQNLCQTRNVGLDIIRSFAILFVIAGHFLMNTSFNSSIFEGGSLFIQAVAKMLFIIGVPIGVSTRGLGEFLSDSVSEFIDEDSYALITWDFTRNPNLEKAVLSKVTDSFMETPIFREFIDAYKLRDSVDESYDHERLKKEFMLMREESMKTIERIDKILTHL